MMFGYAHGGYFMARTTHSADGEDDTGTTPEAPDPATEDKTKTNNL